MQRCCPISEIQSLTVCPVCQTEISGLWMLPLSFHEIKRALDEAAKTNLSRKRGKKRRNATLARLNPSLKAITNDTCPDGEKSKATHESSDLRTGRWTPEEIEYCDKVIEHFSAGTLPIPDDIRLHVFLANLFMSKGARLTKKMKNARLSSHQFKRKEGGMLTLQEARELSQLETDFFASVKCNMERSEIKFHMQRVWRDLFVSFCAQIGQELDASDWLKSVAEFNRRFLERGLAHPSASVGIVGAAPPNHHDPVGAHTIPNVASMSKALSSSMTDRSGDVVADLGSVLDSAGSSFSRKRPRLETETKDMTASLPSLSYVDRVIQLVQNGGFPFEHADIWVPSNVFNPRDGSSLRLDSTCRLCFAGHSTGDTKISPGSIHAVPMTSKEKFDMISFGIYSQNFSFPVDSGMPGRIYASGVPFFWEQGIQSAPQSLFQRVAGAQHWGIETVLGLPLGNRAVVLLYSMHDRPRDVSMVNRLLGALKSLLGVPIPRWNLTVEVAESFIVQESPGPNLKSDSRIPELLALIDTQFPVDQFSPLVSCLPALVSLRLVLLKHDRSKDEGDALDVALNSYEAFKLEGRSTEEIVRLTSCSFMAATQQPTSELSQRKPCGSARQTGTGENQQHQSEFESGDQLASLLDPEYIVTSSPRSQGLADSEFIEDFLTSFDFPEN
jgi:hypothetical protein